MTLTTSSTIRSEILLEEVRLESVERLLRFAANSRSASARSGWAVASAASSARP